MKLDKERIVYSLNVRDVQKVAKKVLKRELKDEEIRQIENTIAEHIDWHDAISSAIILELRTNTI